MRTTRCGAPLAGAHTVQIASNKNRFVFGFLAYLLIAGWFKQIFYHLPLESHGCMDLDSNAAHVKTIAVGRQVSSVPALQSLVNEGHSKIIICELTHVIDVHALTDKVTQYPTGISDFHFLHLYPSRQAVHLRARSSFWLRPSMSQQRSYRFAALRLANRCMCLSASTLLFLAWFGTSRKWVTLCELWWLPHLTHLLCAARLTTGGGGAHLLIDTALLPEWTLAEPKPPYAECVPAEEDIAAVVQAINASLRDVQKIMPQQVAGMYTSKRARTELAALSLSERLRSGLDWLPSNAELTELGADVDRINRDEEQVIQLERRASRPKHVIVSVRTACSQSLLSGLTFPP